MRYAGSLTFAVLVLVWAGTANAQGPGLYIRTDCLQITSPVTGQTWCFDATAQQLKVWNGSAYVSGASGGVTSIAGTASEVLVNTPTGAVTLSTPQAISSSSDPTFHGMTLTSLSGAVASCVQVNTAGVLSRVVCSAGGSTSPGGADTNVQYNSGGTFAGSASLTWTNSIGRLGTTALRVTSVAGAAASCVQVNTSGDFSVASAPCGGGTVSHAAGSLTNSAIIVGGGAGEIRALAIASGVIHQNASGDPFAASVSLTNDVQGILQVAHGGTGLTTGTSGGLPFFNASTTMASSALLTAHAMMVGGGAGVAPKTLAALTTGQAFFGVTGADPSAQYRGSGPNIANILDYGADPSASSATNVNAIQAAHDALSSSTGGVLYIPAGVYHINAAINISKPITIVGDGMGNGGDNNGGSVLVMSSKTLSVLNVTAEAFTFRDFQIAYAFATTAGTGILVNNDTRGHIQRVWVQGAFQGIDVEAGSVTIDDVNLNDIRNRGLTVRNTVNNDAGDWTITNSVISLHASSTSDCIYYESGGGLRIVNNKLFPQRGQGVTLNRLGTTDTGNLFIQNNSIEGDFSGSGSGVFIERTAGTLKFTNTLIQDNEISGFVIGIQVTGSSATYPTYVSIIGNSIDVVTTAISLDRGDHYMISGNIIYSVTNFITAPAVSHITVGVNYLDAATVTNAFVSVPNLLLTRTTPVTAATLPVVANGSELYCTDCQSVSVDGLGAPYTCAGGGTGATATRNNGVWKCIN